MSPLTEIAALFAVCAVACLAPRLGAPTIRRIQSIFDRLARRRVWAVCLVGILPASIDAVVALSTGLPVPAIPDEFSYLLTADTFAQGRLSNPTHELWEHFESVHIFHRPTYQSKYPPGPALVLAAGAAVFGEPIVGVWFSIGVACASVCWMMYGWLPARWALLGGLLAACNIGIVRYWGHHYVGGAVALTGGALLFGALPRLMRAPTVGCSIILAIGLVLLADSRPWEGMLASLPAAIAILAWMVGQNRPPVAVSLRRVVLPIMGVLILFAGWIGYYNYRVTGNPRRLPYQVWQETYMVHKSIVSTLSWTAFDLKSGAEIAKESAGQTDFNRQFHAMQAGDTSTLMHGPHRWLPKLLQQWGFYVRILLTPALLMLPLILRNRRMQFAALTVGIVLAANMLANVGGHAHYLAPAACLLYVLIVQGLRYIRQWHVAGRPSGRLLSSSLVGLYGLSFVLAVATDWVRNPVSAATAWSHARAAAEKSLATDGRRHVVIVDYGDRSLIGPQWVYNAADIDRSPVVWARDLGTERNNRLCEYFADRTFWRLDVNKEPLRLAPYPRLEQPQRSGAPDGIRGLERSARVPAADDQLSSIQQAVQQAAADELSTVVSEVK